MSVSSTQDGATAVTHFGTMPGGAPASLYTVRSGGLVASFTNYGARLVTLEAPDRAGRLGHVVLGFDSLTPYLTEKAFLGATVGRVGNRIAQGRFALDGINYQVPLNDGAHALHGGSVGFDRKVWAAAAVANGVEMTLVSPAGDQGFPGTLTLAVRYTLSDSALHIDYTATSDAATVVNVTNHAYFNLAGPGSETILEHTLELAASRMTPVDAGLIPTGELAVVEGTPFDFLRATRIGDRIADANVQLERAGGYDHNWVLDGNAMKLAARLRDPSSGRVMAVETTEPGIQFYSGNFLDGSLTGRDGAVYARRSGLCLETQHFPDSPNQPAFPSIVLRPGETMHSSTVLTFSVEE